MPVHISNNLDTDKEGDSHRFNALTSSSADVHAEYAMTPPFALARQSVQADNVAESSFHGSSFEVYPVNRGRTVIGRSYGRRRRIRKRGSRRIWATARAGRIKTCRGRRPGVRVQISIVFRNENRAQKRNKLFVCYIGQWIVIDDRARVCVICKAAR